MTQDWHNKLDEKLFALRDNHDSVTYQTMIEYLEAAYECAKENMVISSDKETVLEHWVMANGFRELLDSLRVDVD